MLKVTKPFNQLLCILVFSGVCAFSVLGQETPDNFEILPLVSLKHIVVASHKSFCKNLVDYFRQAALAT